MTRPLRDRIGDSIRGKRVFKEHGPTEKQIHQAVIDHWRACRTPNSLVATIPNMRAAGQAGLTKGLPDLLVIAPGLPIGFIELKRHGGAASDAQSAFSAICNENNIPWELTFGRDHPIEVLERWGAVKEMSKSQ